MPAPPRSTFALNFLKGLRTNTDAHLQLDGELSRLENAQVNKLGAISKRTGYQSLTRSTFDGATLSEGHGIQAFQDELLQFDGYRAYAYSSAVSKWINRGKARSVIVSGETIIRNDGYQQTSPTVAVQGSVECHLWKDERGGYRYALIDLDTRTRLVADGYLPTTGTPQMVRMEAFAGSFVFVHTYLTPGGGGAMNMVYRTLSTSGTLSSETTLLSSTQNLNNFEMCPVTSGGVSRLFIAYSAGSAPASSNQVTRYLDTSFVLSSANTIADPSPSQFGYIAFPDSSGNVWVGYLKSASSTDGYVYRVSFNNSTNITKRTLTFYSAGGVQSNRLCGYADTNGTAHFYAEFVDNATPSSVKTYFTDIYHNTVTSAGTVGTPAIFKRGLGIIAKPFTYDGYTYLMCSHQSTLQSTLFLVDTDGDVAAKVAYQLAGGMDSIQLCSDVADLGSGRFMLTHTYKGRSLSEGDYFFTRLGLRRLEMDLNSDNAFLGTSLVDQLINVGGVVSSYDRSQFNEANFHLYPENITLASSISGGSMTSSGVYQYKVVFAATDAAGNVSESRPSVAQSITMGVSDTKVTLTIPTLRLTARPTGIRIDIYRTTNGGSTFRKVTSSTAPTYNNPDTNTITFVDTLSDTALASAQLIYTDGERENIGPPNSKISTSFKSRVFLGGTEDVNVVWLSKVTIPGVAAEHVDDDAFKVTVNPVGGELTAMAPLNDGTLCIFRESAIYSLSGEGPTAQGQLNDYFTPEVKSLSVGCAVPGLVTDIPQGLIFPSLKGIYTIGEGALTYIGEPVAAYNDGYSFKSVDRIPNTNQVRFTTSEGKMLVYDFQYDHWGVWSSLPAVDACVWQDQHTLLTSDGYAMVQSDSIFQDNGSNYNMLAATSWYFPAGLGGYCQLDAITLEGEYLSTHQLVIHLDYDGVEDTSKNNYTISSGNMTSLVGTTQQYVIRVEPRKRCESFKVTLTATGSGACANWSGLRADIAPLPGANRLVSGRRSSS